MPRLIDVKLEHFDLCENSECKWRAAKRAIRKEFGDHVQIFLRSGSEAILISLSYHLTPFDFDIGHFHEDIFFAHAKFLRGSQRKPFKLKFYGVPKRIKTHG